MNANSCVRAPSRWLLRFFMVMTCCGFVFTLFLAKKKIGDLPLFPHDDHDVFTAVCNSTVAWERVSRDQPVIYLITPTYTRREQVAEMTRLAQTLLHVPNLVWIVAEDSRECSPLVERLLHRFGMPFVHLASPMPSMYKKAKYKPRGVSSRNAGLQWIIEADNAMRTAKETSSSSSIPPGVIYFADDDNTYDLRIFDQMRSTKKVSLFPVGLVGEAISGPIVKGGKVIGFTDPWFENRKFPVDMAGFAVHTDVLLRTKVLMPYRAGHEETMFVQSLQVPLEDMEPLANDCTEVLVWHTKTEKSPVSHVMFTSKEAKTSSLGQLVDEAVSQGILAVSDKGSELPVCFRSSCPTSKIKV